MFPVEFQTAVVATGEELHFFRIGNRDLPAVILLHGLSQQANFWTPVIEALKPSTTQEFQFLAIDQRGHGYSQAFTPDHDFSMSALASDVIAVMDGQNISRAILVGHSMGATVAVRASTEYSERIEKSVLIDGGVASPADLVPQFYPSVEDLRVALTPPPGPYSLNMLREHYGSLDPSNIESILAAVDRTYTALGPNAYVSTLGLTRHMLLLDALINFDATNALTSIEIPTWVILCEQDLAIAEPLNQRSEKLMNRPQITIQHWYGYEHDVPLQRPTMIAALIESVIRIPID